VKCTLDEIPSIFVRDKPIFSSERIRTITAGVQPKKKNLVVGFKGLDAKTN
jgi:hypothetical protein